VLVVWFNQWRWARGPLSWAPPWAPLVRVRHPDGFPTDCPKPPRQLLLPWQLCYVRERKRRWMKGGVRLIDRTHCHWGRHIWRYISADGKNLIVTLYSRHKKIAHVIIKMLPRTCSWRHTFCDDNWYLFVTKKESHH
jgi:hypothetical protein